MRFCEVSPPYATKQVVLKRVGSSVTGNRDIPSSVSSPKKMQFVISKLCACANVMRGKATTLANSTNAVLIVSERIERTCMIKSPEGRLVTSG
jgi:hypothetical protein